MMDLAMNFDTDECLVTAMFDKGNRNDTMEAIDHIIPFLKGDADMIVLCPDCQDCIGSKEGCDFCLRWKK